MARADATYPYPAKSDSVEVCARVCVPLAGSRVTLETFCSVSGFLWEKIFHSFTGRMNHVMCGGGGRSRGGAVQCESLLGREEESVKCEMWVGGRIEC